LPAGRVGELASSRAGSPKKPSSPIKKATLSRCGSEPPANHGNPRPSDHPQAHPLVKRPLGPVLSSPETPGNGVCRFMCGHLLPSHTHVHLWAWLTFAGALIGDGIVVLAQLQAQGYLHGTVQRSM
jgi:hypothetical protein